MLPPLTHSHVVLITYTGEKISPLGTIDVHIQYETQEATLPLLVVPGDGPSLIGRNWLQEIKLNWSDIKIVHSFSSLDNVLHKHEDVFRPQLGNLKDVTAKIHVVPQAHPRFFRARSVPHSLKDKVA